MGRMLMRFQRVGIDPAVGRNHGAQRVRGAGLQVGKLGQDGVGLVRHVFHGLNPFCGIAAWVAPSQAQRNNYAQETLNRNESVRVGMAPSGIFISCRGV